MCQVLTLLHIYGILDLDHALSCLTREDPSLRVSINQETGQTVLSGMGELHLEIIHDRLKRDFKVDCSLGKLQVAYREAPSVEVTRKGEFLFYCCHYYS